jgi:hypothetical protein
MTVKITSDKAAAVDQDYFWRPLHTCPLSAKVQLLTEGGVAVYGQYSPGFGGRPAGAEFPARIPPRDWLRTAL